MRREAFSTVAERTAGLVGALLGWRPAEFWGATPAEVVTALRGVVGPGGEVLGLGGDELAALRERFPDG